MRIRENMHPKRILSFLKSKNIPKIKKEDDNPRQFDSAGIDL